MSKALFCLLVSTMLISVFSSEAASPCFDKETIVKADSELKNVMNKPIYDLDKTEHFEFCMGKWGGEEISHGLTRANYKVDEELRKNECSYVHYDLKKDTKDTDGKLVAVKQTFAVAFHKKVAQVFCSLSDGVWRCTKNSCGFEAYLHSMVDDEAEHQKRLEKCPPANKKRMLASADKALRSMGPILPHNFWIDFPACERLEVGEKNALVQRDRHGTAKTCSMSAATKTWTCDGTKEDHDAYCKEKMGHEFRMTPVKGQDDQKFMPAYKSVWVYEIEENLHARFTNDADKAESDPLEGYPELKHFENERIADVSWKCYYEKNADGMLMSLSGDFKDKQFFKWTGCEVDGWQLNGECPKKAQEKIDGWTVSGLMLNRLLAYYGCRC